ncbi:hypothetical protein B0H63DRAFT_462729 [Podospora didyma]|uniref:Zn(2)-C6 fungal-type domain-containing protein n=1 Tax=Podospora didyma TaxID=330526 RepID=A0AAE0P899_9PEZI|nr:hypothetical protein B0H63DRAFT_462729 [Podospora didyma]
MATMDPQFTHGKLLQAATVLRLPVDVLAERLGLAPDIAQFASSTSREAVTSPTSVSHLGASSSSWVLGPDYWAYPGLDDDATPALASSHLSLAPNTSLEHDNSLVDLAQWAQAAPDHRQALRLSVPRSLDGHSSSLSWVSGPSQTTVDQFAGNSIINNSFAIPNPATPATSVSQSAAANPESPSSSDAAPNPHNLASGTNRERSGHIEDEAAIVPPRQNQGTGEPTSTSLGPCSKVWVLPKRIQRRKPLKQKDGVVSRRRRDPAEVSREGPKPRGRYTDEAKKRKTALTRILKSCIRCRMNRGRCNPDETNPCGPCLTCKGITGPTLCKMPCYRYIVTDASLYREQAAPYQGFTKRWQSMDIIDIPTNDWASPEIRTIVVSPNYVYAPFEFRVREFIPIEGDLLEEKWMTATGMQTAPIPRYALAEMHRTARDMKDYIERNTHNFINATVGSMHPLLWGTYLMAFRHIGNAKTPEECALMANTFRLWVTCRLISNPVHICGEDTLGGRPVYSAESLHNGKVPMPLFMTAQFECINFTSFLRPWSKLVLKQLNELVLAKKREYWFTIYLSMFVLLHSCAMMTKRDEEFARQFDAKTKYANPDSIRAHHTGAQTMLAHFHFINKGVVPFSLPHSPAGRQELARAANLSEEQLAFVWRTSDMVKDARLAERMRDARERNDKGDDFYWISMLYDEEWKPISND